MINRRNLLAGSSLGFPFWSLVRAQQPPRTIGFLGPYKDADFRELTCNVYRAEGVPE